MQTINCNIFLLFSRLCFFSMIMIGVATTANAQLSPMGTSYFNNEYLTNPALAGVRQELKVNLAIRRDFNSIPGSPMTQSLTADYGVTSKAALALLVYNDRAGILKNTLVAGTFAYHLSLSSDQRLSFGLSLSFTRDQIDQSAVNGDITDPNLLDVNERDTYIDGNFGARYLKNDFEVQLAFPNIKRLFNNDNGGVAERAILFSAVSYRLNTRIGTIRPKLVYRRTETNSSIFDGGANWELQSSTTNKLNVFGMYHSSKSATFGIGMNWNETLAFTGMYNTNTSGMQSYTSGNFELSLSYTFLKKRGNDTINH